MRRDWLRSRFEREKAVSDFSFSRPASWEAYSLGPNASAWSVGLLLISKAFRLHQTCVVRRAHSVVFVAIHDAVVQDVGRLLWTLAAHLRNIWRGQYSKLHAARSRDSTHLSTSRRVTVVLDEAPRAVGTLHLLGGRLVALWRRSLVSIQTVSYAP